MRNPANSSFNVAVYRRCGMLAVGLCLLSIASGCSILGVAASKASRVTIKPAYTGFANQTAGVMVTADRGTQIDYPRLQLDIAQSVQAKLQGAQANKAEELTGLQFQVRRRFLRSNGITPSTTSSRSPRLHPSSA